MKELLARRREAPVAAGVIVLGVVFNVWLWLAPAGQLGAASPWMILGGATGIVVLLATVRWGVWRDDGDDGPDDGPIPEPPSGVGDLVPDDLDRELRELLEQERRRLALD
jgi:hypothetical protein